MDNLDDFYDPRLKLSNLEEIKLSGKYEPFFADIQDRRGLQEVFEEFQPEAVVDLAAPAGVRPSLLHPKLYVSTNVSGTLNLLELSRNYGVEKFVFGSSSSVYGEANRVPFPEDDTISQPISIYAATKVAGESLAFTYSHLTQPRGHLRPHLHRFRTEATPGLGDPQICPYNRKRRGGPSFW